MKGIMSKIHLEILEDVEIKLYLQKSVENYLRKILPK